MVELNSAVTSGHSLLGVSKGLLNLRIRGTHLDGRIIRIRAQKCSIGAAPDCGVRIHSSAARPIHCVIFRGRQGTLVRRWAPDTLLNGKSFQEAWLQPGDRLSVGPVEFDILDEDQAERLLDRDLDESVAVENQDAAAQSSETAERNDNAAPVESDDTSENRDGGKAAVRAQTTNRPIPRILDLPISNNRPRKIERLRTAIDNG